MTKLSLLKELTKIVNSGGVNLNHNLDYGGDGPCNDWLLTVDASWSRYVLFITSQGTYSETVSELPAHEVLILVKQLLSWLVQKEQI